MIIIFCSEPFNKTNVDVDYLKEYGIASELGVEVELISYEELVNFDNATKATRNIKRYDQIETAIYRGWMMSPEHYEKLYLALKQKNISLVNSTEQYTNCHYLPNSYDIIKDMTPISIWFSVDQFYNNFESVCEKLSIFNGNPIMVKDYVKSRKHEWNDACYIHSSNDEIEIKRVTNNFVTRQAEDLNVGLVFREFIELEFLTNHSKSNMPLTKEYRIFVLNKKPISIFKYWDEGEYSSEVIPVDGYREIIDNINSNFFTIDIAKQKKGGWIIIEVGDGQVSGLPDNANIKEFYEGILY